MNKWNIYLQIFISYNTDKYVYITFAYILLFKTI